MVTITIKREKLPLFLKRIEELKGEIKEEKGTMRILIPRKHSELGIIGRIDMSCLKAKEEIICETHFDYPIHFANIGVDRSHEPIRFISEKLMDIIVV